MHRLLPVQFSMVLAATGFPRIGSWILGRIAHSQILRIQFRNPVGDANLSRWLNVKTQRHGLTWSRDLCVA